MSEKFSSGPCGHLRKVPSLPKLESCKVPSELSYFLVLRAARKGEGSLKASLLETGGQANCFCFCLFLYHFVLPQPNLCVDREVGLGLLCLLV